MILIESSQQIGNTTIIPIAHNNNTNNEPIKKPTPKNITTAPKVNQAPSQPTNGIKNKKKKSSDIFSLP
jgi:hypothetical protein